MEKFPDMGSMPEGFKREEKYLESDNRIRAVEYTRNNFNVYRYLETIPGESLRIASTGEDSEKYYLVDMKELKILGESGKFGDGWEAPKITNISAKAANNLREKRGLEALENVEEIDARNINRADESINALYCCNLGVDRGSMTFEEQEEQNCELKSQFLNEAHRVLRKGGMLVISGIDGATFEKAKKLLKVMKYQEIERKPSMFNGIFIKE